MSPDAPFPQRPPAKPSTPHTHRRLLRWEGTCCRAQVHDLGALSDAADMLGLGIEDAPEQDNSPADVSLEPFKGGYLLKVGTTSYTLPAEDDPAHYLAITIPWTFYTLSPDPVLHAAGFVVEGEAVLLCGRSGVGKSSLTAAAWKRGLRVMNDDCTVVDPARAIVRPFPQGFSLRIDEPVVPAPFVEIASQGCPYYLGRGLKSENWVLFGRSLPGMVTLGQGLPVRALYFIRRGSTTRRSVADRQTALKNTLAQTYPGQAGKMAILPFVEALFKQGKIHELEVGDGDISNAVDLAVSPLK